MWTQRHLSPWLRIALFIAVLACAADSRRVQRGLWDDLSPPDSLEDGEEDYAEDTDHNGESGGGGKNEEDPLDGAKANLEFTHFDYSDACAAIADARWKWLLTGEPGSGPEEDQLWKSEAALGACARDNEAFMKNSFETVKARESTAPQGLADELEYALHPGDLLLSEPLFEQKLNYSRAVQRALSDLRVPCHADAAPGEDTECVMTLPVVRRVLMRSGDPAQQLRAWVGAQEALRPLAEAFPAQLALARAAAAADAAADAEADLAMSDSEADADADADGLEDASEEGGAVGAYWRRLLDPDDYLELTFARGRELWAQVKPLHRDLAAFVRARLVTAYGEQALAVRDTAANETLLLPAHLLGSLLGDDWSPLADIVFPNGRLRALEEALEKQGLEGRALYGAALQTLNASLGVEGLPAETLLGRARFDGECPARVLTNSSSGAHKVLACARGGWQEYAHAHDVMTRLAHAHLGAEEDQKSLLRVITRYSALHDMLPAIVRVLSLHPDRLQELDVFPDEETYEDEEEAEGEKTEQEREASSEDATTPGEAALRLLSALRVLPRLAYLAAGDAFRMRLLAATATANGTSGTAVDPMALWAQVRREYMLVAAPAEAASGDASWLADPLLAGNSPLLGRFVAELLAFQALEYLASYDPEHPLEATRDDGHIPVVMKLGRSKRWPEVLNEQLVINELRAEPLLRFLAPLRPLLSPAAAAKAPAPPARPPVDLTPPVPPPPPAPSASSNPFAAYHEVLPSTAAPAPEPSPSPAPDDAAGAVEQKEAEMEMHPSANPSDVADAGNPARAAVGDTDNPTAHTAVLATSLAIFGAALAAGAIVGGRRLLKKRSYERNRRPDAANGKVANNAANDVEAAVPEEAQPVNTAADAPAEA